MGGMTSAEHRRATALPWASAYVRTCISGVIHSCNIAPTQASYNRSSSQRVQAGRSAVLQMIAHQRPNADKQTGITDAPLSRPRLQGSRKGVRNRQWTASGGEPHIAWT